MLDLDPDEKEVNLADNDVLEMIPERQRRLRSAAYLAFLYSNSICKQSAMPTSILMLVLLSGGIR